MSVGDLADIEPKPPGPALRKQITPAVQREIMLLAKTAKINRDYDVLWLGGRSRDGSTVYIDSRVPRKLTASGLTFDPAKTLPWHEIAEWYCMHKLGMKYEDAHRVATWTFEKPRVEAWGLGWRAYQKLWEKLAAPNDVEKIDNPPPDIDLAPYEEVGTKEQVKAMKVKGARENRLMKAGA